MWDALPDWAGPAALISLGVSLLGAGAAVGLIVWLPADHFVESGEQKPRSHAALHVMWICTRNALGGVLVLAGVAMMILPGPGILAVVLGLSLIDIPGKLWLLQQGLRLKSVRKAMNWIRRTCGSPPLEFPKNLN